MKRKKMDRNQAAAHIAYAYYEVAAIFTIILTPIIFFNSNLLLYYFS